MNFRILVSVIIFCLMVTDVYAADSYRFLHVTIDTPWAIFVFLLFIVMFPFVLMAVLYWYFAFKKPDKAQASDQQSTQD